MDKARAVFDELARERPSDSEVRKCRLDALVGFHVALSGLALDRRRRGKADESAVAQKKADDFYADLSRGRPNDPEVDAARRQAQLRSRRPPARGASLERDLPSPAEVGIERPRSCSECL